MIPRKAKKKGGSAPPKEEGSIGTGLEKLSVTEPKEEKAGQSQEEIKADKKEAKSTPEKRPFDTIDVAALISPQAKRIDYDPESAMYQEYTNKLKNLKKSYYYLKAIDLDAKIMQQLDADMISLNDLTERFTKPKFNFFCTTTCKEIYGNLISDGKIKDKRAYVRGPAGFGKTFGILYTLLQLRKDDEKYRVLHIGKACDIWYDKGYMLNEILKCCYLDKELIPPPKDSKLSDKPLYQWYGTLCDVEFWDNGSNSISKPYNDFFAIISRYYNTANIKFVIVIDQENSLFTTLFWKPEIAYALRGLKCDHMIVSASNNNEGFKQPGGEWKIINVENTFDENEAKLYIEKSPLSAAANDPDLLERIQEITLNVPGELYSLLYQNLPPKVEGESISQLLDRFIKSYLVNRKKEITESHIMKFTKNLSPGGESLLQIAYYLIDTNIDATKCQTVEDKGLMYTKNGKLCSLCPLAHDLFKTCLMKLVKREKEPWIPYVEIAAVTKDSVEKSCLLEEAIKMYFEVRAKRKENIQFQLYPVYKKGPTEFKDIMVGNMELKKGKKSQKYYEGVFRLNPGNTLFNLSRTFDAIDAIICGKRIETTDKGKVTVWFLYGIQITSNILSHDSKKERSSPDTFFLPDEKNNPFVVPAFKAVHEKDQIEIKFIWMGGPEKKQDSIHKKVEKDGKEIKELYGGFCSLWYVLTEREEHFPQISLDLIEQPLYFTID
eukprot:TRINITY_DN2732_c0_g1_i1.p1 TRINITY_DN2732_c0_g1~~TRINITY_DN2732_c0_g1_i1.p1  ORF type:complete len:768 (+),score=60.51 TRINITY_DN2732_c0_g1_i1:145-2304(+)